MNELQGAVEAMLLPHGEEQPPAGAVLAVRRGRETTTAFGGHSQLADICGDLAADLPMTIDTAFDLASITKAFTTVSLLRLVSSGEVALDDELRRFVPTAGPAGTASIRSLLQHRSGLWEWWPLYMEATSPAGCFDYLDSLELRYEPGSGRHYSDLGFMYLGRVIEATTGLALDRAVAALVTEPLGLRSTRYASPLDDDVAAGSIGDSAERRMIATGVPYPVPRTLDDFSGWRTEVVRGQVNDGNAFHALAGVSGHAGLFSTVPDLLDLATALSDYRRHEELWSPAIAEQFFAEGPDEGQALGFRRYRMLLDGEPVDLIGHSGYTGGVIGFVPDRECAIVLATNRLHTRGETTDTDRLWSIALSAAERLGA
jgi:CubicO group peptidase (beta-lactamase class C family)